MRQKRSVRAAAWNRLRIFRGEAMTTIVIQNPHSRKLERYDIRGLTAEELQALQLDERTCEEVSAAVAPCLPEEFLAAYVVRVGVIKAGQQIIGSWIANRLRDLFTSIGTGATFGYRSNARGTEGPAQHTSADP